MNNMHVVAPTSESVGVSYALGILNSKLMNWYYHTLNPEMGEALAEVKKENVARLPLAVPNKQNRGVVSAIEGAVSRLIAAKANMLTGRDEHLRKVAMRAYDAALKDLNCSVYQLYSLSED